MSQENDTQGKEKTALILMKLVSIGMPGAGKSTQGNLLSRQLRIPYLSTGHIFRHMAKEKTKLGRYVRERVRSGLLIPDDKVIPIVEEYLKRPEYKNGYILDGFPRTVNQAKKFRNGIDKVLYLEISDKEALWRLAHRNETERDDDTVEAIKRRIKIFHRETKPVLDYYKKKNKLVVIDGASTIEEVNRKELNNLGKKLVANKVQEWKRKQKIILAFVGLPGSGKTSATKYLTKTKKVPAIQFGEVINEHIDKKNLAHTAKNHKLVISEFRQKYGMEALACLNEAKIKKALASSQVVIIDGLRSWEEYVYLKKRFKESKLKVVALYADRHLRYERIGKRKYRSSLAGEERDINELMITNMGPTIANADFVIKNMGSREDFHYKLNSVYQTVYFS